MFQHLGLNTDRGCQSNTIEAPFLMPPSASIWTGYHLQTIIVFFSIVIKAPSGSRFLRNNCSEIEALIVKRKFMRLSDKTYFSFVYGYLTNTSDC